MSTSEQRPSGLTSGRLEAFSDGVLAILITIMVLQLSDPATSDWHALFNKHVMGTLLMYLLSFTFLGIYWNNHHHLFSLVGRVDGAMLWANLHLLFWLSLIPFATRWIGLYGVETAPTAAYGFIGMMAAIAYYVLVMTIIRLQGDDSLVQKAFGDDWKGKLSVILYALAIAAAFVLAWIAIALFVAVALMWLVPDRRIEAQFASSPEVNGD